MQFKPAMLVIHICLAPFNGRWLCLAMVQPGAMSVYHDDE
jgi:hypothetical protein